MSELKRNPERLNALRRSKARQLQREIRRLKPTGSETINSIIYKCSKNAHQRQKRMEAKLKYYDAVIFRSQFVQDLARDVADRTFEGRAEIARRIQRAIPRWLAREITEACRINTPSGPKTFISKEFFETLVSDFVGQVEEGDWDLEFPKKYLEGEK